MYMRSSIWHAYINTLTFTEHEQNIHSSLWYTRIMYNIIWHAHIKNAFTYTYTHQSIHIYIHALIHSCIHSHIKVFINEYTHHNFHLLNDTHLEGGMNRSNLTVSLSLLVIASLYGELAAMYSLVHLTCSCTHAFVSAESTGYIIYAFGYYTSMYVCIYT